MNRILSERLNQVNEGYFQFNELPPIKWSKGVIKKKYRKLTFGTYDIKNNQIRIHPILKNEKIPVFVLDFVIYHEMLHYEDRKDLKTKKKILIPVISFKKQLSRPIRYVRKKNYIHTSEFHNREKEFPGKSRPVR